MSMLESFAHKCTILNMITEDDPAGGSLTIWQDGATFTNYQTLDMSTEAKIAQKLGVTSVYGVLVKKSTPLQYGSVYRDNETGHTFRVTSDPKEKQAPRGSNMRKMMYCTAERWELPG